MHSGWYSSILPTQQVEIYDRRGRIGEAIVPPFEFKPKEHLQISIQSHMA